VGSNVLAGLKEHDIIAAYRKGENPSHLPSDLCGAFESELEPNFDWSPALKGVEAVLHLAGRAHVLKETEADPLAVYRRINRDGTLQLARQARDAGVKRFVFVSSIGVNGAGQGVKYEGTGYTGATPPEPHDDYAISKREAEDLLNQLGGIEIVSVRPPLITGRGVPGNLRSLLRLVEKGIPLPLLGVANRRSFVSATNLAEFFRLALVHPAAPGHTFTISDDGTISTPDLVRALAKGMGKKDRQFSFPLGLALRLAKLTGKTKTFGSLFGSLVVDNSDARNLLGWRPSLTLEDGLLLAGQAYAEARQK
jgi:nucleoside-diphosphate-sugar epimerase